MTENLKQNFTHDTVHISCLYWRRADSETKEQGEIIPISTSEAYCKNYNYF